MSKLDTTIRFVYDAETSDEIWWGETSDGWVRITDDIVRRRCYNEATYLLVRALNASQKCLVYFVKASVSANDSDGVRPKLFSDIALYERDLFQHIKCDNNVKTSSAFIFIAARMQL